MGTISPNKVGLALGALIGGWHVVWAFLVAVGWAQWVLNFVLWMHFLKLPYTVEPFSPGVSGILVLVTATVGYAFGYIFGVLWNWIHR